MTQPPKMLIAREIMHELRLYQILRNGLVHYFKLLKSDTPYFLPTPRHLDAIQKSFCTTDPSFHRMGGQSTPIGGRDLRVQWGGDSQVIRNKINLVLK